MKGGMRKRVEVGEVGRGRERTWKRREREEEGGEEMQERGRR